MNKKIIGILLCVILAVLCLGCANTQPPEGLVTTDGATVAPPVTDEPKASITDPPTTDPVTDAPFTDEPVTDEPVTDAPVTEGSVTEAPPITDEVPKISEDEFIEGLKDIFANAKTVEELNAAVSAFDTEKRVNRFIIQQYMKGPALTEGELVDGVYAIASFDDGLWVRRIYPDRPISSKEYDLYEAGTLLTALQQMLNDANTYGELLAAIEEYDVYEWIKTIELHYGGNLVTDPSTAIGVGAAMRVDYGTSSWMQWIRKEK